MAFVKRYPKLHTALALAALFFALLYGSRRQRGWINWLTTHVTAPVRQALGKLSYRTDVSVMEVLAVALAIFAVGYVIAAVMSIARSQEKRRQFYRFFVGALCIVLLIYDGFWLLWGINFWADGFQDQSGIRAEEVADEDLVNVTVYIARRLLRAAQEVPRDEGGLFAVPVEEILERAPYVYDEVETLYPFLTFDDLGVKPMIFSRLMSIIDFTGFYCPYTGESNVNVDAPACLLPSTAAHEMAHQRGLASEQECNFLAVLASVTSNEAAYVYSGWLMAYIYVGNALYSRSPELYWDIRNQLSAGIEADLAYNTAYWDQFRDTKVQELSDKAYDALVKGYGDERGIQSYGAVVDLLVTYYKDAAAAEI